MPPFLTTRTAVCAAALLITFCTSSLRAQDTAQSAQAEAPAAQAQPAPEQPRNPTDVVARVGDRTITEADLTLARQEFGSELGQIPEEQQRSALIDALVNIELLARAAQDAKLDQGPDFERRVDFLRKQALRNAYVEQKIVTTLTPEDLQKGYETLVLSQYKPEEQIRARHILVEKQDEAQKIIEDLKAGVAFEELAKQSKDPSGQQGGDLGFFGRGQMVPPFEQAAFALEPGSYTQQPVESEFGWHVIRVEEKRMSEPPALADVEGELRNFLIRQKFETAMADLRKQYSVEIMGRPEGPGQAPAVAAPDPADATPAAPAGGDQPQTGEAPADPVAPATAPAAGEQPQ